LAKLDKPTTVSYLCEQKSDWFFLWLDPIQLMPLLINCWSDNIRLVYDNATHTTSNSPGVQIKFPNFGNTTPVEYLDVGRSDYAMYFGKMVETLVRSLGYRRGENLFGAPYDFRKAANEHQKFFSDFKALIEDAYEKNGGTRVVIVTHSMGSPMTHYFLVNQVSAEWKAKYVRAFVSLSGVFGGTVRAMKVFAVGDNLGNYFVSQNALRFEQRGNPSLAWLMPSPDLWAEDEVLVQSANVNVTLNNFDDFYDWMGLANDDGKMMRHDVLPLSKGIKAPGVEVFCWHGVNVSTVEKLVYSTFPTSSPEFEMGDGDGTVNRRSMEACLRWKGEQDQPVHHKTFWGIDHAQMIKGDIPSNSLKHLIADLNKQLNRGAAPAAAVVEEEETEMRQLCGNSIDDPCPTVIRVT